MKEFLRFAEMIYREIRYHGKSNETVSQDFFIPLETVAKIYELGENIVENGVYTKHMTQVTKIRGETK